jgi:hypothetical protein
MSISKEGFFVGGPHGSFIVYDSSHVSPLLEALCEVNGDDSDDYTCTDLDNPVVASPEEVELIKKASMVPSTIYLNYYSYNYVTEAADPTDSWDRDNTDTDNTLTSVNFSNVNNGQSLAIPFTPKGGKDIYIVWAEYSTGDSFGHDGGQFEVIDAFSSYKKAKACEQSVYGKNSDEQHMEWIRENGVACKTNCPWYGYFENLETIHISKMTVE